MSEHVYNSSGGAGLTPELALSVSLPVLPPGGHGVRKSRMSRRRWLALAAIHLLIIGHVVHWLIAGRTLSPIEPSEAMFTLNQGHLNAGFIFFAAALLATLVLGGLSAVGDAISSPIRIFAPGGSRRSGSGPSRCARAFWCWPRWPWLCICSFGRRCIESLAGFPGLRCPTT